MLKDYLYFKSNRQANICVGLMVLIGNILSVAHLQIWTLCGLGNRCSGGLPILQRVIDSFFAYAQWAAMMAFWAAVILGFWGTYRWKSVPVFCVLAAIWLIASLRWLSCVGAELGRV